VDANRDQGLGTRRVLLLSILMRDSCTSASGFELLAKVGCPKGAGSETTQESGERERREARGEKTVNREREVAR
jgi:hypothetical protein